MTGLPIRIAFRYLFARKSYNVINMISGIGTAGMAIGTAALVIILSVFNGFNSIVEDSISDVAPSIIISPAKGKVFEPDSAAFSKILQIPQVLEASSVLEDQAFLLYEGKQSVAKVKGLDSVAQEDSPLKDYLVSGTWSFRHGSSPRAVAGAQLAQSIGASPRFVTPLEIYYPIRSGSVSITNPVSSLKSLKIRLAGTVSVNAGTDAAMLYIPLDEARELFQYEREVSSIEIRCMEEDTSALLKEISGILGPEFKVLDRYRQNYSVFRMMKIEKFAIYMILVFVVLIIAFNIYSSLKMLVIEKQGDIQTLRSLGAKENMLRKIFLYEGWLVSLFGMIIGLLIGILAVVLQGRLGIVPMPGNYVVQYYPVVLKFTDIILITVSVALTGFIMAYIPSRKP